jgi:hypothetical protein
VSLPSETVGLITERFCRIQVNKYCLIPHYFFINGRSVDMCTLMAQLNKRAVTPLVLNWEFVPIAEFDLAQIDARKQTLHISPFYLARLITVWLFFIKNQRF